METPATIKQRESILRFLSAYGYYKFNAHDLDNSTQLRKAIIHVLRMIALKRMDAKAQGYQQELDTIIQEVAYLEMKKKEEIKRQQGISLLLKTKALLNESLHEQP